MEAKAAAPPVKPAAPAVKPAAPPKPAAPAPLASAPKANKPVVVPLLRAGQTVTTAKPVLTPKEALAAKTKAHAAKTGQAKHEEAAPAVKPAYDPPAEALAATWESAKTFVDQAGEAASTLVDAWLAGNNAAALAAIADASDISAAARKAARRALNVLRSRGVAIPERPRAAKVEEARDTYEATLIPSDASGTWSIAITMRDPSGRYRIGEVIGRDSVGVVQAAGGWLSGSQLKEGRVRAQTNVGMAPVPVPLAWARARVKTTLALNTRSGQVVPLGYESCRDLFDGALEAEPAHPVADLEERVTSEMASELAKTSGSLHGEPEFAGWVPDRRALDEMMQHVGERLGPSANQDMDLLNAALREEIQASTDRYFSPEVRDVLCARMRDSAISVRARKGDERALDVLAAARAVREAGLITSPPREIPFLVMFFQKGLNALVQLNGGQLRIPRPQQVGAPAPLPVPAEPAAEAPAAPSEGA